MPERWLPTITEAYESFILDGESSRWTVRTLEHYRHRLGAFLRFLEIHHITHVTDITPTHIRQHLLELKHRNLSSFSQHASARTIRAWLNFCVREELLTQSPMRKVSMPKLDKKVLPHLSPEEVHQLLNACESPRETAFVLFLIDTGIRATEFCSLNGGDIDIKTGNITIRQGKGRKDRVTFIGNQTTKAIMRHWRKNGKPGKDEPLWISERNGERLTRSGLRQVLVKVGKRAGLKVTPHKLRRTFATWAWRLGMNPQALQHLMGHAELSTLRAYLGIDEDDLKDAHDKYGPIDNFL